MIIFLRFISLLLISLFILRIIGEYTPFLAPYIGVILIITLIICLYYALKIEIKNFKKRKE
ncbi:hypothetical protein FKN04_12555 [Bacillus glycinifermentans]|nr:hypothetical protein [Bacillus glycinifermentans]